MLFELHRRTWYRAQSTVGFTLFEVLVVLVIIGVLAAIAAPSWAKFIATQEVNEARNEIRQGILRAQNAAISNRTSWRFTLREAGDHLEWAIHANDVAWADVQSWESLSPNVILHDADTTLAYSDGAYYVRFGHKGNVRYRLSTVTLDSKNGIAKNQCVVISTLIGATRKGEEKPTPKGDRYCY